MKKDISGHLQRMRKAVDEGFHCSNVDFMLKDLCKNNGTKAVERLISIWSKRGIPAAMALLDKNDHLETFGALELTEFIYGCVDILVKKLNASNATEFLQIYLHTKLLPYLMCEILYAHTAPYLVGEKQLEEVPTSLLAKLKLYSAVLLGGAELDGQYYHYFQQELLPSTVIATIDTVRTSNFKTVMTISGLKNAETVGGYMAKKYNMGYSLRITFRACWEHYVNYNVEKMRTEGKSAEELKLWCESTLAFLSTQQVLETTPIDFVYKKTKSILESGPISQSSDMLPNYLYLSSVLLNIPEETIILNILNGDEG